LNGGLRFHNVHKRFHTRTGEVDALAGFSLDVAAGEFVAVVGPSGCGKSTMLHIAAGLDTQFEGEFTAPHEGLRSAYLFQTPRLLPWLTAEDNVAFVPESTGHSRSEALREARAVLAAVGLVGFERSFPAHLSGGMQQRVALARALSYQPEVLLMDEPFGTLDELTARKLRSEVVHLSRDQSRTIIFVTHNVTEAAFLADRVVVMSPRPGRVVAEVPVQVPRPRDYDDPAVATTARAIVNHLHLE
jgi:NitT/TauT family transport system ATP-binding protein